VAESLYPIAYSLKLTASFTLPTRPAIPGGAYPPLQRRSMPSLSLVTDHLSPSHFEVEKIDLACLQPWLYSADLPCHLSLITYHFSNYSPLSILSSPFCSSGSIVQNQAQKILFRGTIPHFEHESELFQKNSETKTIQQLGCRAKPVLRFKPCSRPKRIQFKSARLCKNLEPGTCEPGTVFPPIRSKSNTKIEHKNHAKKRKKIQYEYTPSTNAKKYRSA
jgi:hypothetical protein